MGHEAKKHEIRTSWKMRTLGTLAGWLVRAFSRTLRMKVEDRCGLTDRSFHQHPVIYCVWHSRILAAVISRNRFFRWRRCTVLTSASRDGAALASLAGAFGMGAVRGSSSRRGSRALRELVRVVQDGRDVGITPDGPRGPRYRLHPGLMKLAQLTRAPLVGIHVHFGCAIRLKTWDRFTLPLPFSSLTIIFDELLEVPRELDDDAFEAKRVELECIMRAGADDLDLPTHDHSERKRNSRRSPR